MERKIGTLAITYLFFLVMLFLSGSLSGIISDIVYAAAFIIPLLFALYRVRDTAWKNKAVSLDSRGVTIMLESLFPTVLFVFLLSCLTSYIMLALFGVQNEIEVGDNLFIAILSHALLPAIFEEMLFRYLPIRLFGSDNARTTVFVSALFFALIHHDLFAIPYSFLAGVCFMTVDLLCSSILPSIVMHFVNNLLSVLWIFYSGSSTFSGVFVGVLVLLSLVSAAFIYRHRREYKDELFVLFSGGEQLLFYPQILYLLVPTLFIAVANLVVAM